MSGAVSAEGLSCRGTAALPLPVLSCPTPQLRSQREQPSPLHRYSSLHVHSASLLEEHSLKYRNRPGRWKRGSGFGALGRTRRGAAQSGGLRAAGNGAEGSGCRLHSWRPDKAPHHLSPRGVTAGPSGTFALPAEGAAAESRRAGEGAGRALPAHRAAPAAATRHEGTCRRRQEGGCRGAAPGARRPGPARPSPAGQCAPQGRAAADPAPSASASSAAGRSAWPARAARPMGSMRGGAAPLECARGGGRRPLGAAPGGPGCVSPGAAGKPRPGGAFRAHPTPRRDPRLCRAASAALSALPGSARRCPPGLPSESRAESPGWFGRAAPARSG